MKLTIGHLYPKLLNIYGDRGNIITLVNRCQWRGIKAEMVEIGLGDPIPDDVDLFFGGGGQDKQQLIVADDLQTKKAALTQAAEAGVPMLTICGTYQLFGNYFITTDEQKIPGIGIFDAHTEGAGQRKIGNVVSQTDAFGKLVGFENHSGNTFIKKDSNTKPLGKVLKGFGNNDNDQTEGAVYKNVFGTYLHGPLLPKNFRLADHLIKLAVQRKDSDYVLKDLDDKLELQAYQADLKLK